MPEDPSAPERYRVRNGLVFLVAGVLLLLWAWGSWLYRTWQPGFLPTQERAEAIEAAGDQAPLSTPLLLFIVPVVLLLALFGGYFLATRSSSRQKLAKKQKRLFSTSSGASGNWPSRNEHS